MAQSKSIETLIKMIVRTIQLPQNLFPFMVKKILSVNSINVEGVGNITRDLDTKKFKHLSKSGASRGGIKRRDSVGLMVVLEGEPESPETIAILSNKYCKGAANKWALVSTTWTKSPKKKKRVEMT